MTKGRKLQVRPDYHGGGIVNLMASIAAKFGHRTGYPLLRDLPSTHLGSFKKIVLLILDGLGWHFLLQQSEKGFLKSHLAGRMTSVFPATTASAITTFATGAPPSEHGVTGWFTQLRELGSVAKILFAMPRHGGMTYADAGIPMSLLMRSEPLFKNLKAECFLIVPEDTVLGDFTRALADGGTTLGYRDLDHFCKSIGQVLRSCRGPTFISAYWPELDSLGHHHGLHSQQIRDHFRELDAALYHLHHDYRNDETLWIITADHGMVDTPPDLSMDLERYLQLSHCLSLPLCGEPRMVYCYLHPERRGFFCRWVRKHLGYACRLYTREDLLAKGFFGSRKPESWFFHRVGDVVLAMEPGYSLRDFLVNEDRSVLLAGHGGLDADEMLVPLILAR